MTGSLRDVCGFADLLQNPAIFIDAKDHRILFANAAARRLFAPGTLALDGASLDDVLDEDPQRLASYISSCAVALDSLPWTVRPKDGSDAHTLRGRRLPTRDDQAVVFLEISQGSNLRHRFALLTRQMEKLRGEIARRQAAEDLLRLRSEGLAETVAGLQALTAIDTTRSNFMDSVLRTIRVGHDFGGLGFLAGTGGRWTLSHAEGTLAPFVGARLTVRTPFEQMEAPGLAAREAFRELFSGTDVDIAARVLYVPVQTEEMLAGFLVADPVRELADSDFSLSALQILAEGIGATLGRAAMEERLRHSQRLEAVGHLTGGIAHDFNNILAVVLGNVELLLEEIDGEARELAGDVRDAAMRGATLTSRLLSFARKQPLDPVVTDIDAMLSEIEPMIRRTIGAEVDISVVPGEKVWMTCIDRAQFVNAVLNLCINARDAMPGGGKLLIETCNAVLGGDYAADHEEVRPGRYVLISVSDTGTGMDAATRERAFDPFFTTKGIAKGSGLGLSMVFGYVKQSGGHAKIYSEPGEGTTVKLYLPRNDADAPQDDLDFSAIPSIDVGKRILVVEDDEQVRSYAGRVLKSLGFGVVSAPDGPTALDLDRSQDFDVYLLDVILPGGMNGRQVADEITARKPDARMIFMSGYTEKAVVHNGRLDEGVHLISKPFRKVDLIRKLAEVLTDA